MRQRKFQEIENSDAMVEERKKLAEEALLRRNRNRKTGRQRQRKFKNNQSKEGLVALKDASKFLMERLRANETKVYNEYTKYQNAVGMATKIKGNRKAFEDFVDVLLGKKFETLLQQGLKDPNGEAASSVLAIIKPILHVAGKKTINGSQTISEMQTHGYALSRHYGSASLFFTVAFDDVNNPTSFRLCMKPRNNEEFPSVCDESDIKKHDQRERYRGSPVV